MHIEGPESMRPYCRWEAAGSTAPQDRSLTLHDTSAYRQQEWFAMDLLSNFQYARCMVEAFPWTVCAVRIGEQLLAARGDLLPE